MDGGGGRAIAVAAGGRGSRADTGGLLFRHTIAALIIAEFVASVDVDFAVFIIAGRDSAVVLEVLAIIHRKKHHIWW